MVVVGKQVANYFVSLDGFPIDLVERGRVVPPEGVIRFGDENLGSVLI